MDSIELEYEVKVNQVAKAMVRKLLANRHKGHWKGCPVHLLIRRVEEELEELKLAIAEKKSPDEVMDEVADVCNMMMMAHDNYSFIKRREQEIIDGKGISL